MDPWQLISEGRFNDAVDAYTQLLQERPSPPNYSNRGIAFLNLGRFDSAQSDFEAAEALSQHRGDAYLKQVGVVHWLAGRDTEAVEVWQDLVLSLDRGKIAYTDAAGGVGSPCLLWFAGVRLCERELQKMAERSLQKTLQSQRSGCWPAAIGQFVLGWGDAAYVRESLSSVPMLRERQLCQAEFYIAVRALHDRRPSEYLDGLRRCGKLTESILENEYYLARHELPRAESESGE